MANVIELLAQQTGAIPGLATLKWDISGSEAIADLERLGRIGSYFDQAKGGKVLVIIKPPPTLPWMNALAAAGWSLSDLPNSGWGWTLAATLRAADAVLRVQGFQSTLPDGTSYDDAAPHSTMAYFSPPPPPLGRSKAARALLREWGDRMRSGDWGGWTATPLPVLSDAATGDGSCDG
jgi:hypothetical protein